MKKEMEAYLSRRSLLVYFALLVLSLALPFVNTLGRVMLLGASAQASGPLTTATLLVSGGGVLLTFVLGVLIARVDGIRNLFVHRVLWLWGQRWLCLGLAALLLAGLITIMAFPKYFLPAVTIDSIQFTLLGIAAFLILLIIGVLTPWLDSNIPLANFLKEPRAQLGIILLSSLLLGIFLFGNMLNRQWWWFDDGNVILMLGRDYHIAPTEIPQLIATSEISRAFQKVRFRPTLWLMLITEATVWGYNPSLYYMGRFVMIIFSMTVVGWVLARLFGLFFGFLVTMWIWSYTFWADIWARLAAAETSAVPGLALYVLASYLLIQMYRGAAATPSRKKYAYWLLYTVSGIVTIGSKESFLVLLLPNTAFLFWLIWRKRLDRVALTSIALVFATGIFIALSVGIPLLRKGSDVYGNSIEAGGRLALLSNGFARVFSEPFMQIVLLSTLLITVVVGFYLRHNKPNAFQIKFPAILLRFVLIGLGLLLGYVSQYVFYNGAYPANMRYDFPGRLAEPLFGIVVAMLGLNLLSLVTNRYIFFRAVKCALALFLIALIAMRGFGALEQKIASNVESSHLFTSRFESLVPTLARDPNAAVVFESHFFWDHEPVLTTAIFLRAAGLDNPFFVRLHPGAIPEQPIEKGNAAFLQMLSQDGYNRPEMNLFTPLAERDQARCYSIGFSGTNAEGCTLLMQLFP